MVARGWAGRRCHDPRGFGLTGALVPGSVGSWMVWGNQLRVEQGHKTLGLFRTPSMYGTACRVPSVRPCSVLILLGPDCAA